MPSRRVSVSVSRAVLVAVGVILAAAGPAAAAFPRLAVILPRGVERGGDRELVFQGERLAEAEEVMLHPSEGGLATGGPAIGGPRGLVVKSIEPIDEKSFKAVIHVPADSPPGEQIVQVRTRTGITEYRSFHVGILPVVDEQEPNNAPAESQSLEVDPAVGGVTVHGIVTGEDIDCFAVALEQGDRLSVEVEALRLGSHRFDSLIAVLGPGGEPLAVVDDHPAALQDGFLSLVAAESGRHVVQIREAAWGGDGNSRYRLHIGRFPRPSAVYPAGGRAGETVTVTFLGDASGPIERQFELPAAPADVTTRILCTDEPGSSPTGLAFRISSLGNTLEQEPNDDLATATPGDTTTAFNGIIETPGDVDHYRFTARKGESLQVDCHARRLGSGLDPVVAILAADGRQVAANDDAGSPDSSFKFDPPADGEYVLRVKDHLGRGRADFTYRVEMLPTTASLALSIPRIDRYSQTRQTVFVPRGNRYGVLLNVQRRNFDGELSLEGNTLPEGITMTGPRFRAGKTQVPVVFEAAADAPLGGMLVDFQAHQVAPPAADGTEPPDPGPRGGFVNNADFVLGNPNNAVHYTGRVERLAMAVIDEVPFRVEIVQPRAPLVRKGRLDLVVRVTRAEGFSQPVTVEFPFRPAGVAANPSITIPADQSEGVYQLNANDKAELGSWPVYVLAAGDVGGTAWVASPLATLEIAEPFTEPKLARAAGNQGATVPVACMLEQVRPFAGEAIARLVGLPPEATAPELSFTPETAELVFEVITTDKTPPGNHKTVFVEIVTPVDGEVARMSGPTSELQIAKPATNETVAAPPPSAKPLSRLQLLRQQTAAAATP